MHYWSFLIPVLAVIGAVTSYSERIHSIQTGHCWNQNNPRDTISYRENSKFCEQFRHDERASGRREHNSRVKNEIFHREISVDRRNDNNIKAERSGNSHRERTLEQRDANDRVQYKNFRHESSEDRRDDNRLRPRERSVERHHENKRYGNEILYGEATVIRRDISNGTHRKETEERRLSENSDTDRSVHRRQDIRVKNENIRRESLEERRDENNREGNNYFRRENSLDRRGRNNNERNENFRLEPSTERRDNENARKESDQRRDVNNNFRRVKSVENRNVNKRETIINENLRRDRALHRREGISTLRNVRLERSIEQRNDANRMRNENSRQEQSVIRRDENNRVRNENSRRERSVNRRDIFDGGMDNFRKESGERRVRDSHNTRMKMRMSQTHFRDNKQFRRENSRWSNMQDTIISENRSIYRKPSNDDNLLRQIKSRTDVRIRDLSPEFSRNECNEENGIIQKERFNYNKNERSQLVHNDSTREYSNKLIDKSSESKIKQASTRVDARREDPRASERYTKGRSFNSIREERNNRIYLTPQHYPQFTRFGVQLERGEFEHNTERKTRTERKSFHKISSRSVEKTDRDGTIEGITDKINASDKEYFKFILYITEGLYISAILYKMFGKRVKNISNDYKPQRCTILSMKALKVD